MAKVSAFSSASKKTAPQAKGPSGPIFVCDEHKAPDGEVIYTAQEMVQNVTDYCEGKDQYDRGDALMKKSRKPIIEFARAKFADIWAKFGTRPDHSPKVLTDEKGDGAMVTVEFQDAQCNLTEDQFEEFAEVVGSDNARSVTTKRFEYALNPEMLEMVVADLPEIQETDEDGNPLYFNEKKQDQIVPVVDGTKAPKGYKPKMRKQTYFDLVDAALAEKFTEVFGEEVAGDKIGGLLIRKPVFKTNKGMIDRLLDFVGRGTADAAQKLAEAIEKGNIRTALKAGALAKKAEAGCGVEEED